MDGLGSWELRRRARGVRVSLGFMRVKGISGGVMDF